MRRARRLALALVLGALWLASLALPVATQADGGGIFSGAVVLVSGWLGPLIYQFGWLANLILVPALIALVRDRGERRRSFVILGGLQFAFAINALFWTRVADDGGEHRLSAYHSGYWCWLLAVAGSGVWLLWAARTNARARRQSEG